MSNQPFPENRAFYPPKKRQESASSLSNYVFGKVMPQALENEEAVLGALLLDSSAFLAVSDTLKPEYFYTEAHQAVYKAICTLQDRLEPVDLITVTNQLQRSGDIDLPGISNGYLLVTLSDKVASSANIEAHARAIIERYIARKLIEISTGTVRDAYEGTTDVIELLGKAEHRIMGIATGRNAAASKSMSCLILEAAEMSDMARTKNGMVGIPSGIKEWDDITGGFYNGELTILAGRPGMGKTAAVMTVAKSAARSGKSVLFASLEMPSVQLALRLAASEAGVPLKCLRRGTANDSQLIDVQRVSESFSTLKFEVDDTPGLTLSELRAKCRRMKSKKGLDLVIIDYLQLMTGDVSGNKGGNREQEISSISRGLKMLAKEMDCPVIALSQLSRAVETRGGSKRPIISDLRESGSIEQDADVVAFIYRPEVYGILEDENGISNVLGRDTFGNVTESRAEIIIAKQRQGEIDTAYCKFVGPSASFCDIEPTPFSPQNLPTFNPNAVPRNRNEEGIPF